MPKQEFETAADFGVDNGVTITVDRILFALEKTDPISVPCLRRSEGLDDFAIGAAVTELSRRGCVGVNVGGRRVIASAAAATPAACAAAAMTKDEIEVLAVIAEAGGIPRGQGSRVFGYRRRKSFRPALSWLDRAGLVAQEPEGGLVVTQLGSDVLAHFGKDVVEAALEPSRMLAEKLEIATSEANELAETMLTAVMGDLRLQPSFGDGDPCMVDAAVIHVLASRRRIMTVELIDMIGVPGKDVRASVERLEACGVAGFGRRYRRDVEIRDLELEDLLSGMDAEDAETWLAVRRLGTFNLAAFRMVRACLGRNDGLQASRAALARLIARGHLIDGETYQMTETGRGFAEWLEENVSGEEGADEVAVRIQAAVDEALNAVGIAAVKEFRELARKARPMFVDTTLDEGSAEDALMWSLPPDRFDARLFEAVDIPSGIIDVPLKALTEAALHALHRMGRPASVSVVAGEAGLEVKKAAEGVADLLALGLAKDASEGAALRASEWKAFCGSVKAALQEGEACTVRDVRVRLPGADFADVKAALRYLSVKGELKMQRKGPQKLFSLPGDRPGRRLPVPGAKRGENWSRMLELIEAGVVRQPDIATELGISSERVRQIGNALEAEGRVTIEREKSRGSTRVYSLAAHSVPCHDDVPANDWGGVLSEAA